MKPIVKATVAFATLASLSGCAAALGMEQGGLWVRDVTLPLTATVYGPGTKVGRATATSILGLVNSGNAGIEAAKRSAGIARVSHVDYQVTNFFGIYATYTVIVYGD